MTPKHLILFGRLALAWERCVLCVWRGCALFAALLGGTMIFVVPFGIFAAGTLGGIVLLWDMWRFAWPNVQEGARYAEHAAPHRPLSTLNDTCMGGDETLWAQAIEDKKSAIAALPLPWPRAVLGQADPLSLRLIACFILCVGILISWTQGEQIGNGTLLRFLEQKRIAMSAQQNKSILDLKGQTPHNADAPVKSRTQTAIVDQKADSALSKGAQKGATTQDTKAQESQGDKAQGAAKTAQKGQGVSHQDIKTPNIKGDQKSLQNAQNTRQDEGKDNDKAQPGDKGDSRQGQDGAPDKNAKGPNPVPVPHAPLRRLGSQKEALALGPAQRDPLGRPIGSLKADKPSDNKALSVPERRAVQEITQILEECANTPSRTQTQRDYCAQLMRETRQN